MRYRTLATRCVALSFLIAACDRPDDQPTGSISAEDVRAAAEKFSPDVRAALDSGNTAYRDHDFAGALRHYQHAAELDGEATAAWFGVYMAQRALGDTIAARAALERARDLAPGASILHPTDDE
jgi:hypothetical protein